MAIPSIQLLTLAKVIIPSKWMFIYPWRGVRWRWRGVELTEVAWGEEDGITLRRSGTDTEVMSFRQAVFSKFLGREGRKVRRE